MHVRNNGRRCNAACGHARQFGSTQRLRHHRPAIPIHHLSGRPAFDPCPILLDRSLALGPGLLLATFISLPLMVLGLEAS